MMIEPVYELGIKPADGLQAECMLVDQRRRQPQQRLMMEYAVPEIANLVQCR